jgi:hypothetical protein
MAAKSSASSPPAPEMMVSIALPLSYLPKPSFLDFNSEISRITSWARFLVSQKSGPCISSSNFAICLSISFVSFFSSAIKRVYPNTYFTQNINKCPGIAKASKHFLLSVLLAFLRDFGLPHAPPSMGRGQGEKSPHSSSLHLMVNTSI